MPPADEALDALAQFVVDVGGGDHGRLRVRGRGDSAMRSRSLPPALSQEPAVAFLGPWCLRLGVLFGTMTITRNPP